MSRHEYVLFDPLFDEQGAEAMVRLCERFGAYGMYSQENVESEIGRGLTQRHDAVRNYLRSGGMRGEEEPVQVAAARTNYFREEYAYGTDPLIDPSRSPSQAPAPGKTDGKATIFPGIEPFLFHEGFVEAARRIHGRPVVEPAIVFANLMVPGQELALHTDVPEFRGANRKLHPQWLLVAMRHSGLFEDWRMPIATGVAWFHSADGGEFVFYPDGPDGARASHEVAYNTAIVIDTDSVFHGVDRVASGSGPLPRLRPGMQLVFDGGDRWSVQDGDEIVERYGWDELRFSVSWKAYCFADEAERDAWRAHSDDLDLDRTLTTLIDDLRARGRVRAETPPPKELALLIIDEYIRFPAPV